LKRSLNVRALAVMSRVRFAGLEPQLLANPYEAPARQEVKESRREQSSS